MNDNELNNALIRYMQLCEAFRDSDIWSDEAKQAIQYFLDYKEMNDNPIYDLYWPLFRAGEILRGIKEGKFRVSEKHSDIRQIADEVWFALDRRSYVRDNTSDKEIKIESEIVDDLVACFGRGETTKNNKFFLWFISGEVEQELNR